MSQVGRDGGETVRTLVGPRVFAAFDSQRVGAARDLTLSGGVAGVLHQADFRRDPEGEGLLRATGARKPHTDRGDNESVGRKRTPAHRAELPLKS